jgi:hypothetical protein
VSEILLCAILPLLGVVLGWFANHWLSSARGRRARKHSLEDAREARKLSWQKELTDFLADWKGKITTDHAHNLPFVYKYGLPLLQTKAAAVRKDLDNMQRAIFNELVSSLSDLTSEQITRPQGKIPKEVICEPLDALTGFMEAI